MSDNKQIIEVKEFQENEDGSATIQLETSPDVTAILVGLGLQTLVKQAMQEVIDDE
tara:strand:- start:487 stop:654 length:168 start_codon:yes stop_codon:yes gene_type:complete